MPAFKYDVPMNPVGTTIIAFPSLVSEFQFENILKLPLRASPKPIPAEMERHRPVLPPYNPAGDLTEPDSPAFQPHKGKEKARQSLLEQDSTSSIHSTTVNTRTRLRPRKTKSVHSDSADSSSGSIVVRRTYRTSQHKLTAPYPCPATTTAMQNSAYANFGYHKVARKPIWARWFLHRNTQHLQYPPPIPPGHRYPEDNTLFVLVNIDIEADIRASRQPEVVGMPPKLSKCLTIWIWKQSLRDWQSISYGDLQLIDGEELALALGGPTRIEPRWVLYESLTKRGFKKPPMSST
ncbi:hypothetical protein F5890DRAFT_1558304 [Lentinula detonsa]|uniref:Uncharacterized protein n=1 Tax=Lentinula detonsa TaxID=2804962 RepID=A0AA38PQE2_9AGAR|nr:hypothetical protein F5890DRAFT_1558304 [Lentinula detonsa]